MPLVDPSSNQTPRYNAYDPLVQQIVSMGTPEGNTDVPGGDTGNGTVTAGGGGGGGGDGTSTTPPTNPPLDWEAYLQNWGFPTDVVAQLTNIFSQYSDPSQASAAALAYIRGTPWYSQTFPGIQAGLSAGLFSDESGYRSYVNDLNQLYQNYYGRQVNGTEVASFLNAGHAASYVGQHLSGQAQLAAEKGQDQYLLGAFDEQGVPNANDLSSYGDYLGGIGNMIGPQLTQRIQKAQQKMQDIFQGTLATPSLSMLNNGRLAASSSSGNSSTDIPS